MKIVKIIIINLILGLLFLIALDFICGYKTMKRLGVKPENIISEIYKNKFAENKARKESGPLWYIKDNYKAEADKNTKKPEIVLIGCSFTYGDGLERNEAFYNVLKRYTNRTVYNFGISGAGPKEFLYILKDENVYKLLHDTNNVEYVIYTYILDHKRRLYSTGRFPLGAEFKLKNGKLYIDNKDNIKILFCYFYKTFMNLYWLINNLFNRDWKLFEIYLNEMYNETQKHLKNGDKKTKFVVLLYEYSPEKDHWKEINNKNIIVIDLKDLIPDLDKEEYSQPDKHPNKKAWETIVPIISEKLNL